MPDFLNKSIELPRSGPVFWMLAIIAIVLAISEFAKGVGGRYFGYLLLACSVFIFISGIGMAFSKKERGRMKAKVAADLPDRAALINAPDADRVVKRRGYYSLAFGFVLFIIWCYFFGFSSLAV